MQITIQVPDNVPLDKLKSRVKEFEETLAEELKTDEKKGGIKEALIKLRNKGTFKKINNPVEWQKKIRKDRVLPDR